MSAFKIRKVFSLARIWTHNLPSCSLWSSWQTNMPLIFPQGLDCVEDHFTVDHFTQPNYLKWHHFFCMYFKKTFTTKYNVPLFETWKFSENKNSSLLSVPGLCSLHPVKKRKLNIYWKINWVGLKPLIQWGLEIWNWISECHPNTECFKGRFLNLK